jgi:excisionase family DNA binding protein
VNTSQQPPLWGVREAAEYLNTTPAAIYKMVERRQIPHVRLGDRKLRFDPAVLRDWVRQNAIKVA